MPKVTGSYRHHKPHKKWPKADPKAYRMPKDAAGVRSFLKEFRADAVAFKKKYGKRAKYQNISKQAFERESKRKGCKYGGSDEGGYTFVCKDKVLIADTVNHKYLRRKTSAKERRNAARRDRMY
jgi:hypothetical protein